MPVDKCENRVRCIEFCAQRSYVEFLIFVLPCQLAGMLCPI